MLPFIRRYGIVATIPYIFVSVSKSFNETAGSVIVYSSFSLNACIKETENTRITNGTYKGSFQREIAGGGKTSNIELLFNDGTWSGGSDSIKYPALCHGIYRVTNQQVEFQDVCFWTAEFEWSLILNGSYDITVLGDSIKRSRQRKEYVDRYRLVRMP